MRENKNNLKSRMRENMKFIKCQMRETWDIEGHNKRG